MPAIQQIFTFTTQMEDGARAAAKAEADMRAAAEKLHAKTQSAANDALIKELESFSVPATPAPASAGAGPARGAAIGTTTGGAFTPAQGGGGAARGGGGRGGGRGAGGGAPAGAAPG